MSRTYPTLLPLTLSAAAALLWAGCRAGAAAPPPAIAPSRVAVATVTSQQPVFRSTLPGELRAYQEVDLQARVDGFVKDVLVDRGSAVRSGQLLAILDAPDLVARRAAAEQRASAASSQRQQAQAVLARDQGTLKRLQDAATAMPGAVAGNDINIAAQTAASDQAEVAARAAAEAAANRDLAAVVVVEDYLRVTAPFSGEIVRRGVSPGSLAGPSKPPLFQLQQLDPLRLVVDVPEAQAAGITVGTKVSFTVLANPADTFTASVARISNSLRPATRTMPVELDVPNPRRQLVPGMYAQVAWRNQRPYPTLFVPATAVLTTNQASYVERVREHTVEWVPVRQGFAVGEQSEIFGAVKPGDKVVLAASDQYRAGTKVND